MKYVIAFIEGFEASKRGIDRTIDRGINRLMKTEDPFGNMIIIAIVALIVVSAGIFGLNYCTGTLQ